MAGSYEVINYSVRPAKHVERKMIVEALQRLRVFKPLSRYRYVGFGSTYFSDFSLFHRALGIRSMVSIEEDESKRRRFQFNRPFRTIELKFGHSGSVLPTLSWVAPSIVWLDYDGRLDESVLTDIDWVCSSAPSGSVLIVSVNAHPAQIDPKNPGKRFDTFRTDVGPGNVPVGISNDAHLGGWRLASASRTVIDGAIRAAVRSRSGGPSAVEYEQLFNFEYADGARMLTVGGLLLGPGHKRALSDCAFRELGFIRGGADACRIVVPSLTNREIRLLDRHMPSLPSGSNVSMIPKRDRDAYAETYRYFPTFVDTDF